MAPLQRPNHVLAGVGGQCSGVPPAHRGDNVRASSHVVRTPYHRRKRLNVMTAPAIDSAPQVLAYT